MLDLVADTANLADQGVLAAMTTSSPDGVHMKCPGTGWNVTTKGCWSRGLTATALLKSLSVGWDPWWVMVRSALLGRSQPARSLGVVVAVAAGSPSLYIAMPVDAAIAASEEAALSDGIHVRV